MFVPKDSIDINPALVQTMAWHRPGNKTLYASLGLNDLSFVNCLVPIDFTQILRGALDLNCRYDCLNASEAATGILIHRGAVITRSIFPENFNLKSNKIRSLSLNSITSIECSSLCSWTFTRKIAGIEWVSIGPLFIKRSDVLQQDLIKPRSYEIRVLIFPITQKFDRQLGSSASEMPVKFQLDTVVITSRGLDTSCDLVVRHLTA